MKRSLAIYLLIAGTAISAPSPRDLDMDCAIVATEAYSRLKPCGVWVEIVLVRYLDVTNGHIGIYGHALVIWQPVEGANLLAYDFTGSEELETTKHDIKSIKKALEKPHQIFILEIHFLEPKGVTSA